jgi:type I restriction enzyme S subunit
LVLIGEDGAKWASGDHTSFIAEGKYWVNNHAHVIRPNRKIILDEWIVYFLNFSDLTPFITGMTVPKLNQEKMRSIPIPLPPLHEQQRIVSILDEAFAAIAKAKANAEQNLKNTKELFESYLQDVFENGNNDWEVKCLDELGTITSSKRIYKSEYVKDGVPFYRTKEIKELSNGKPITLELFISRERYEQIKKSFGVPQIGDLLISAVGTIGEIMVIENEDEFYFKDGNIVWFKEFHQLDTNYLKYALTAFVEKIKSLAIGAAYSALTIEKLNKYEIAFPKTKTEQQTIVRQLDALRAETQKLEAVYQKKIDDLEELKKSILQKAFAGELKTENKFEYVSR